MELLAHAPGAPTGTVSGTVSGQAVNFASFPLTEAMGRGAAFVASATGNVATGGLKITGTLSGTFQTPSGLSCNAANHQLEMVKLCSQPTSTGTQLRSMLAAIRMRKTRILWLGATTVAIGSLLLTLQTRPERGDTTERFEEPGEARA